MEIRESLLKVFCLYENFVRVREDAPNDFSLHLTKRVRTLFDRIDLALQPGLLDGVGTG